MHSDLIFERLSYQVYSIDPKHQKFTPLTNEEVREYGGVEYQILQTESNPTNSMQAMAVAPIKNNQVDTSEIVIAFAGTNPKDLNDLKTDLNTVVLRNKSFLPKLERIPLTTTFVIVPTESQITSAEQFAENIKADYPNANITTTGHSLGQYIALYIAAENQWKNVGFNGPDPYKILSKDAKDWVKNNPHMLFNYQNKYDKIGNYDGNGTGAEILIDMNMGTSVRDTLTFHNLSSWAFDKNGQIYIKNINSNKEARQILAEKSMYAKLNDLLILSKKLKASGGSLSRNEKIYLDSAQALITVNYISKSMKIWVESVVNIYLEAIREAEDIWDSGIKLAQSIGTEVSYVEILNALQERGITKYSVVFEPTAYYREKISQALKIGETFNQLASEIKEGIQKLEKTDKELAQQIKQGA